MDGKKKAYLDKARECEEKAETTSGSAQKELIRLGMLEAMIGHSELLAFGIMSLLKKQDEILALLKNVFGSVTDIGEKTDNQA